MPKFKKIDRTLHKVELACTKTDGTKYDFNRFALPLKFIEKIHNYEITLDEAIEEQAELKELINKLNDYGPRISKKIEEKNRVLKSARKLFDARDEILDLFEKGIFPCKNNAFETKEKESEEESKKERTKDFFEYIENESKDVNYELLKKHNFEVPTVLAKKIIQNKK